MRACKMQHPLHEMCRRLRRQRQRDIWPAECQLYNREYMCVNVQARSELRVVVRSTQTCRRVRRTLVAEGNDIY